MTSHKRHASSPTLYGLSWPLLVGVVAFTGSMLAGSSLLGDPDTYWHIATGNWIFEHQAIPYQDPFSHTMPGAPWRAYGWLSELLLFMALHMTGWTGVIALAAAAHAIALAYLTRFLLSRLEPIHTLLLVGLAWGLVAGHLLARPHVLAMPLLVIWAASLVRACEENRIPRLWLLVVMVCWANLHGGFTLGLALTAAFGAEAVLATKGRAERYKTARSWALFGALSLAAAMLTPYGFEALLFTWKVSGLSHAQAHVIEWLSPDFHQFQFLELWLMVFLAGALTVGFRLRPVRLVLLLAIMHLALKSYRHAELIGLLTPLFLATPLGAQYYAWTAGGKQLETVDRFFKALAQPAKWPAVAVAIVLLGMGTSLLAQLRPLAPAARISPRAAVQAVQEAGVQGPVFNAYDFGGYLIFSGIRPFIDGRAEPYGDDFLKEITEAPLHGKLGNLLDKFGVTWTLLRVNTPEVAILDCLPSWKRQYEDGSVVVHVRVTQ